MQCRIDVPAWTFQLFFHDSVVFWAKQRYTGYTLLLLQHKFLLVVCVVHGISTFREIVVFNTDYQFIDFPRHKVLIETNQICVFTKFSQPLDVDQLNLTETSLKRCVNTINRLNATLTQTFHKMDYKVVNGLNLCDELQSDKHFKTVFFRENLWSCFSTWRRQHKAAQNFQPITRSILRR